MAVFSYNGTLYRKKNRHSQQYRWFLYTVCWKKEFRHIRCIMYDRIIWKKPGQWIWGRDGVGWEGYPWEKSMRESSRVLEMCLNFWLSGCIYVKIHWVLPIMAVYFMYFTMHTTHSYATIFNNHLKITVILTQELSRIHNLFPSLLSGFLWRLKSQFRERNSKLLKTKTLVRMPDNKCLNTFLILQLSSSEAIWLMNQISHRA